MYYKRSRRSQLRGNKYKATDYLMPFLIIVCAGVIVVLTFNLFKMFFGSENPRAAYLHIVEGGAEMRAWGTDNFFSLTSDGLIMQGDEVRTSAGARMIVEFFDGTIMRMGADTVVEFSSVVDDGRRPSIDLDLKRGSIWINRVYKDTVGTEVTVNSDNIVVRANEGSIFSVENKDFEAIRVFAVFDNDGLFADILREDGKRVVETERVGVGQEVVFDSRVLDRYWKYQSPTVISAISDEFKDSSWCVWNLEEDRNPTEFEKKVDGDDFGFIRVEPEVFDVPEEDDDFVPDEFEEEFEDVPEEEELPGEETAPSGDVATPTITSVAGVTETDDNGFYRVTSRVATLEGTVSGAEKVIVNDYVLQQFSPGNTVWRYYANADFDLMREGENTYEVYAENSEGVRSAPLIVKVFYTPHAPQPVQQEETGGEEGEGEDGQVEEGSEE